MNHFSSAARYAAACVCVVALALIPQAALAAQGDIDTTFGTGGTVLTAISVGNLDDRATSVAIQPDGKIVSVGECTIFTTGPTTTICVTRHHADGTLDNTFNGAGKVMTTVGGFGDRARGVALQTDGKIVVAGSCNYEVVVGLITAPRFCVARYTALGALDTTFNVTGKLMTAIGAGGHDEGRALALQADGKIIVVGTCGVAAVGGATGLKFCVARFTALGALDTTFNTTGVVITTTTVNNDGATSVVVQSDGKIVVAGFCATVICLVRYTSIGGLDSSFNAAGTPGKILFAPGVGGQNIAHSLALQSDGKYVVAGSCPGVTNIDFCVVRITTAGVLDTTFNGGGSVISPVGALTDTAYGVAIQSDGKIVVAGECDVSTNTFFCLARYTDVGVLDTTFSGDGVVISPTGAASRKLQRGVALQSDGKMVVAGSCPGAASGDDFCLQRYVGTLLPLCRMDIDGDGFVLALTDSLIHARVALGLTGTAVTAGITFPLAATRKTWGEIRTFLVGSCAMVLPQ